MAIKPVNTTPHTESQHLYQQFWKQFNDYSAQDDQLFEARHVFGERYQCD